MKQQDVIIASTRMVKMDDEAAGAKTWKMISSEAATTRAISLRIAGSLTAMVALFWTICTGYQLATESTRYKGYSEWVFLIGALTMLIGFLFLTLGLPILAGLFLDLSGSHPSSKMDVENFV